jgi:PAS domain S-box-containing protein
MTTGKPPRKVWIVDDNPIDAARARHALEAYDVRIFHDGSSALECLGSEPAPDVLVLDCIMPGISGLEVCRFLRSGAYVNSPLGIILLTAHRAVEQVVEGLSAGADDYVSKPYEDEELRARVMAQIRSREVLERAIEAEEMNRRLLESAPDAMLAIDGEGRLRFANQEACTMFGSSREELLGKPIAQLIPALPGLLRQPSDEAYRTLPDVQLEGRMFSPTVRLPPTPTAAVTISLRDVTERRQAEARRLDFYSIIAHDLRSPLNAMSLRTDLILRGKHGALAPALTADVEKIKAGIQSLVQMINDFLEIARIESTLVHIEHHAVNVVELVDSAMEGLRPLLEAGALSWKRNACEPPGQCRVVGDGKRLSQVFANLLGNAIKFTPPQGVITTSIGGHGGWVEVSVEDTGQGVPPQALPTLFDRYTRAGGDGPQVAGSGLGLMIVREIVEAHGGSVGVDSTLGAGSRFWVKLPSAPDDASG